MGRLPDLEVPDDPGVRGYLAGLIDADGYVGVSRHTSPSGSLSHVIRVTVANTDRSVINWLCGYFEGSNETRQRTQDNWKDIYRWRCHSDRAFSLLQAVVDRMVIKRDRARLALQLHALKQLKPHRTAKNTMWLQQWREDIAQRISKMNQRGSDSAP